jgi:hypothetical protein
MKLDSQTLAKNKFWVALGAFGLFWLIAVIVAEVAGMGDSDSKKAYGAAKTAVDGALQKGPKNETFNEPWNEHRKMFNKHKEVIWKKGWDLQKGMYTWKSTRSAPLQDLLQYPEDAFGPTADDDANARTDYMNTLYKEQWEDLTDLIHPAEYLGGLWSVVPLQDWKNPDRKLPSREEIWLAQEDFWVKRELLYDLASAIAAVGHFKTLSDETFKTAEEAKQAKVPESVYKRVRFRNINWEVELLVERDVRKRWAIHPESQIKNVHPSRRTQTVANPRTNRPLRFVLSDRSGRAGYFLTVSGEPLAWDASRSLGKRYAVDTFDFSVPFEMNQDFDWDYCPLRRVDAIVLGKHSHRTFPAGLAARPDLKALDQPKTKPGEQPAATGTGGATPLPGTGMAGTGTASMQGRRARPAASMRGGGGSAAMREINIPEDPTPVNQINRARYLHVTQQCRHLPVALQVVCEQMHINDILAALANSRLRLQVTQTAFRDSGPIEHEAPAERKEGKSPSRPETPADSPPGGMGMARAQPAFTEGQGRPGFGGRRRRRGLGEGGEEGSRRVGGAAALDPTADPDRAALAPPAENLVELAVYAVATLYERYPPNPKKNSKPGASATPAKP